MYFLHRKMSIKTFPCGSKALLGNEKNRKAELDKLYRICREMRNAPVYWKNEKNEIRRSGKDAIDVALEKDGF